MKKPTKQDVMRQLKKNHASCDALAEKLEAVYPTSGSASPDDEVIRHLACLAATFLGYWMKANIDGGIEPDWNQMSPPRSRGPTST